MKTNLMGLAVAAAIVTSFSSFGQDCVHASEPVGYPQSEPVRYPQSEPVRYYQAEPVGYQQAEPAAYQQAAQGQYVTQDVQQWVPGRYEQVYVSFCHGNGVRCHGGFIESRWVPGYYTTVQQTVWVPSAPTQTWGPVPYGEYQYNHRHLQARVGVRFGGR